MNTETSILPVSAAPIDERIAFVQKTYAHVGGAVLAFTGVSALLIRSGVALNLLQMLGQSRFGWLIFLALFMVFGGIARKWARSDSTPALQYTGLGVFVLLEALMTAPLLLVAQTVAPGAIAAAGIITLSTFAGLTAVVFFVKRDFTFLGKALAVAGFAALGLIICSIIFGFQLGSLFAFGMVLIAAGYVLYDTSNILQTYPTDAYVAASLNLFADIALMFWYVLRLVMNRD